ncbi:Putative sodium-coupled neutral amino acid transporter 11 [Seminavis robusta]|uniref:Sodium-coupled neutral amino acid transporter 11 n=1 Tax=Seminavis robusta TaxID=568900 RepID=A0A9N8EGP2_9STRA|nr:Putative sodium-coupled neutral amino acid transporter 11 [Seminavis robusta]|eukprot:Sro910_g219100.1 Putative sodium-coupled neutral amino acid transporter 11 (613) ;mRNA; f:16079-17993
MPSPQEPPPSPFFRPAHLDTVVVEQTLISTPQGRHRHKRKKVTVSVVEHKSGILGCAANMMTCIVGSGIVGLPYAMQQTGFVAGIGLILLTSLLTEKSLRLLVETAKHLHQQSYETTAEVPFGIVGFRFILINMFVMAYGAMVTYLMITKSCASMILGVEDETYQQFVLLGISLMVHFPLASMRDMADLEKTSGLAVAIDCTIVALVAYSSPWISMQGMESNNLLQLIQTDTVHAGTLFVGLGVLSFAFECQEAAFLVAGSLETPTVARWARVTKMTLTACLVLAMVCALTGYLGFGDATKGNILDNLDPSTTTSFVAHGLLGATMFATYPLASFVARHVCVVLLFEGRRAHEGGSDSTILNRPDRRILLTLALYIAAIVPATVYTDMGKVLALAGVIGGSCLAYIGPGMLFLAVHGGRFLDLVDGFFYVIGSATAASSGVVVSETTTLLPSSSSEPADDIKRFDGCFKQALFYLGIFPLWCRIAERGKKQVMAHALALLEKNTIEPLRIGEVDYSIEKMAKMEEESPPKRHSGPVISAATLIRPSPNLDVPTLDNNSPNPNDKPKPRKAAPPLEPDPQEAPPSHIDFFIAIFYVCFGVIALFAGLVSLGSG